MSKSLCKQDKELKKKAKYQCKKCKRQWHSEKRLCKPVEL